MKIRKDEGITFDDVLLVPKKTSLLSRSHVDLSTQLTPKIKLSMPIVSPNMDTITESDMAIALAKAGGIGILHRFLTIEEEAREVQRVKRHEHFLVENPATVSPDTTLREIRLLHHTQDITSVLVVDNNNVLLGLVTSRDMLFVENQDARAKDIMTPRKDLVVGKPRTTVDQAKKIISESKKEKLPLIDSKGRVTGLITARDLKLKLSHPEATRDDKGRLRVGAAVGVMGDYLERADALLQAGCDVLVIDIAHGHATYLIDTLKDLRKNFKDAEIIAGNVATYEATKELIEAGADAIKVGIGPGSLCKTRVVAGAGVPQITAVMDSVRAASKKNIPVIADGGIRSSGDVVKALAAGASSCMFGTLFFAGCEESPALTIFKDGEKYKLTRGMASLTANQERQKKENNVRKDLNKYAAEGVEAIIPYKGPVRDVLYQLESGIRSGFSYCGAKNIDELWKNSEFIKMTSNGIAESRPHDVRQI